MGETACGTFEVDTGPNELATKRGFAPSNEKGAQPNLIHSSRLQIALSGMG